MKGLIPADASLILSNTAAQFKGQVLPQSILIATHLYEYPWVYSVPLRMHKSGQNNILHVR